MSTSISHIKSDFQLSLFFDSFLAIFGLTCTQLPDCSSKKSCFETLQMGVQKKSFSSFASVEEEKSFIEQSEHPPAHSFIHFLICSEIF